MRWPVLQRPRDAAPSGPGAAFERSILPHLDAAFNVARWLVRDATLAEDVVQDALMRALAHFGDFRGGDARAWLLRIVRNRAYDLLAERKRLPQSEDMTDPDSQAARVADPAETPEAALMRLERRGAIDRVLASLPVELRECLVLRELEDLSYREIARVTDVPVGTVMSRLWRARRALLDGDWRECLR